MYITCRCKRQGNNNTEDDEGNRTLLQGCHFMKQYNVI